MNPGPRGRPRLGPLALACLGLGTGAREVRGLGEDLHFGGVVDARAYSSTRNLDDTELVLGAGTQLQARYSHGPYLAYADLRGFAETPWREKQDFVREAYLDYAASAWELRLGKQIMKWGRADEINPTDNLTPFDYTLLVSETDLMRNGAYAGRGDAYWGDFTLEAAWVPYFQSSRIPMRPGTVVRNDRPDWDLESMGGALKVEHKGSGFDWSVSYFDGYVPKPFIVPGPRLDLVSYRAGIPGCDFSGVVGDYGYRGEAAYFYPESSGERPQPFLWYVLGVDRTFPGGLYANLQFIQSVIPDFKPLEAIPDARLSFLMDAGRAVNNQLDRITNAASARLSRKFFNDALELGATGIYNFTRGDYYLRPKISYGFSDHWKGVAGGDYYHGKDLTFFGQNRDNNLAFMEIKYLF